MPSSNAESSSDTLSAELPARRGGAMLLPFILVTAGVLVHLNGFAGVLLFDDVTHILENDRIRDISKIGHVLSGRRPVVDLSLAVNFALHGARPWGYHAFNVTIHLLAALTLFGLIRRTLVRTAVGRHAWRTASWIAFITALLWTVHPLQTQSITYLIQRGESMMGLFYLLTLYGLVRSTESPHHGRGSSSRIWWCIMAVISCALGMGGKGVMVTAPVVALFYDRATLSTSWAQTLRRRWGLYMGLATTWIVLWLCGVTHGVLSTSHKVATAGFSFKGISPLEYAATQPGVILRYLMLSLWPSPLCLDYALPPVQTMTAVLAPGAALAALLIILGWTLLSRPGLGFLGMSFLFVLAPTSSLIPIKDTLFEHRMYLPLAAVMLAVVLGSERLVSRVAASLHLDDSGRRALVAALAGAVAVSLGYTTVRRNSDYSGKLTMWHDVVTKSPGNLRGRCNLAQEYFERGNFNAARTHFLGTLGIHPRYARAYLGLGDVALAQGEHHAALEHLLKADDFEPDVEGTLVSLGAAYKALGRIEEAKKVYERALALKPRNSRTYNNLANIFLVQGDLAKAFAYWHQAADINPFNAEALYNLAFQYERRGDRENAVRFYRRFVEVAPERLASLRARALQRLAGH